MYVCLCEKGARTELQDVGVDAKARDEGGKASFQVGHGLQCGVGRWWRRGGRGCAVEHLLDAEKAGFEEGDGGEGGLVKGLVVHDDCCSEVGIKFSKAGK